MTYNVCIDNLHYKCRILLPLLGMHLGSGSLSPVERLSLGSRHVVYCARLFDIGSGSEASASTSTVKGKGWNARGKFPGFQPLNLVLYCI